MGDWIFAFFHLFLLIGVAGYAIVSLFQGNTHRFGIISVLLLVYYFFVLHKPVRKEIKRRRKMKNQGETK
jgi:hypothetical protein